MTTLYKLRATLVVVAALAAHADTLGHLQQQWQASNTVPLQKAKFEQLIPHLLAYRQQAGGKSWQLNYMLGTSYCVTGQNEKGRIALHRVLASYGLPDAARVATERVMADCGGGAAAIQEPSFIYYVPVSGQLGARVHGKSGSTHKTAATMLHHPPNICPTTPAALRDGKELVIK